MTAPKYPLGTDREELERLQLQHRLWSDAAHALWRRAGIAPGMRVLDLGAGPGAATFDLAQLTTSTGRVTAVEESEAFVEHLRESARERGLAQIEARVGDVQGLDGMEAGSFDLAYARWVLCFLPRPEAAVRGAARLLRRGGALCIHDYFNYEAMTPAPRRASYATIVQATVRSWRDNGGDPDAAGRLPGILADAGFTLEHLACHQRVARPGDTMWHWAATWWRSYAPRLVKMGYATEGDAEAFFADFEAMTRERDFLVLPPVFEMLARR